MKVNKELKGVAEEDALRKLLNSESEDEEENEEKKDEVTSNIFFIKKKDPFNYFFQLLSGSAKQ